MKEIPSDKRLWHHVGSLCSKTCNTMSLTQLQSSWDNIVEIYLEIMLFSRLASWLPVDSAVLTRVTDSRWRWAFVTFFRNPVLVPLKTGRFPPPHMVKTHPWRQSAEGERNKIKQNKRVKMSLWLRLWRVNEAVAKPELRSSVLAGFRLLQPWDGATSTDVTVCLAFYGRITNISPILMVHPSKSLDFKSLFI